MPDPIRPATRVFVALGAVLLASGVALGAVAAHAKGASHPEAARLLQTAVLYQLVHGLGAIGVGVLTQVVARSKLLVLSGALLAAGCAMFCASLQSLAWTGTSLGVVAPIGGLSMIAGWVLLAAWAVVARGMR